METPSGLLLSCQGMRKTTYILEPLDGDAFYWKVDRDDELACGAFLDPLPQVHAINFGLDERGVHSFSWQHDSQMEAEILCKAGRRPQSYEIA